MKSTRKRHRSRLISCLREVQHLIVNTVRNQVRVILLQFHYLEVVNKEILILILRKKNKRKMNKFKANGKQFLKENEFPRL